MSKHLIRSLIHPVLKVKPSFLIVGAQKAGTTSLYNYLSQHPQILPNKSWKEIHYFDDPEHYQRGMGWYLSFFPNKLKAANCLTFEATPEYLYLPHVPKLIKQDLGDVKIIILLREPVSRAYSAWRMYKSFANFSNPDFKSMSDQRSFTDAILQEMQGEVVAGGYPHSYIDRGKYVYQINNYLNYFDRGHVLVLNFDDLQHDLDGVLSKVCDFLEIAAFNSEVVQTLKTQKFNVRSGKGEQINPDAEILAKLKNYFIPFNERLFDRLGYQFSW